jgi:predicted membrane-bound spermidine synthase/Flp pilus assembly protein TadD
MAQRSAKLRGEGLFWIALVCFFFSGVAGLVYEVVWMRMLTQIFGNTTYAIATVLAAFMAGLALGSYVFGRIADAGKNDFLLYGVLEAGVGIYGLLVPLSFKLGDLAYRSLFQLSQAAPTLFNLLLFFLSFALLMVPTLLMGATLPVLSRFFVRSLSHLGRRVGDLYATNTLGAVLGCALAGYYLIPALGMRRTVYIAAALNLAVALVIFVVDRLRDRSESEGAAASTAAPAAAARGRAEGRTSWLGWVLLFAFGLSGFAALVYENAWTRALTLVLGSSVYSFTTMLVTFLVGLSVGGFLYARLWGEREARVSLFGLIELLVGVAALATIPLFERLPFIFLRFLEAFGDSFNLFLATQLFLSALVMLLPTLLLGTTFPLVARLFTQSVYRVGSGVGTSYAANTLGAILGAFAGGFVFIPALGVQNTILLAVAVNLLVGWGLIVLDPRYALAPRLALGGAVLLLIAAMPYNVPRWDRFVLTSGVTIYADRYKDLPLDSLRREDMRRDEILYYREGLTATVSVHRIGGSNYLYFKTNGKIDGSYGDALSQLLTGYIPLLLRPQAAERAAVIGLGTGMTAKAVATFPVKEIEVLEIEPAIVEVARFFTEVSVPLELPAGLEFPAALRGRVRYDPRGKALFFKGVMSGEEKAALAALSADAGYREAIDRLYRDSQNSRAGTILEDPRVRIIPTDGRNYLVATPRLYDVITAEPSNPWIAGIANLYTREFYASVKEKLKPDGIFAQWIHNYSMSPDDFRMVFRTFGEAFPHVTLWGMKESDFLLVGSKVEQRFDYARLKEIFASNASLRDDFHHLDLHDPYAALGFYRMGREEILEFSRGAAVNTDDGGELEFSAPKNVRRATSNLNRRLMEPFIRPAPWLGASSPAPAMRHFYLAQSYAASDWHEKAIEEIDKAIELEPRKAEFYVLKAKVLLEQDESAPAAEAALKALELDPEVAPSILAASEEFYLREAKAVYGKVIALGRRDVLPYLGLGNIALHYRELAEAEKWFARAREIRAEHPAVLMAWGRLMLAKGNPASAKELLERARAGGENSATLHAALGETYLKLEMWADAAESYQRALRFGRRRNLEWRRNLGVALRQQGRVREAERRFREVLALAPDDVAAFRELQALGKRY